MPDPLSETADAIAAQAPAPRDDAIKQSQHTAAAASSGARDRYRRAFDPALHETGPDGGPVLTRTGNLKLRPKGAGAQGMQDPRPRSELRPAGSGGSLSGDSQHPTQSSRAAAVAAVGGIQAAGMALGGAEWAYRKDERLGVDEELAGIEAFEAYFEQHGITDIPPGIGIAIWGLGYALPRFTQGPKTRARLKGTWEFVKAKLGGRRRGARSDRGNDRERQNNARGPIGAPISDPGMENGDT